MARRSRLIALGLSVGAFAGLVAGMRAEKPPAATTTSLAPAEPESAVPPAASFAGQRSITQTGAS
ncbi:MAG TPA: hypothetical protein VJ653_01950 [Acidimicrobiales bacterium]|nr:hypothetical protein [Acidimicrobiales bacterium]